jgi:hypothetical protein
VFVAANHFDGLVGIPTVDLVNVSHVRGRVTLCLRTLSRFQLLGGFRQFSTLDGLH